MPCYQKYLQNREQRMMSNSSQHLKLPGHWVQNIGNSQKSMILPSSLPLLMKPWCKKEVQGRHLLHQCLAKHICKTVHYAYLQKLEYHAKESIIMQKKSGSWGSKLCRYNTYIYIAVGTKNTPRIWLESGHRGSPRDSLEGRVMRDAEVW
jgi:hypothetical protein